jgi:hypothetical protein
LGRPSHEGGFRMPGTVPFRQLDVPPAQAALSRRARPGWRQRECSLLSVPLPILVWRAADKRCGPSALASRCGHKLTLQNLLVFVLCLNRIIGKRQMSFYSVCLSLILLFVRQRFSYLMSHFSGDMPLLLFYGILFGLYP